MKEQPAPRARWRPAIIASAIGIVPTLAIVWWVETHDRAPHAHPASEENGATPAARAAPIVARTFVTEPRLLTVEPSRLPDTTGLSPENQALLRDALTVEFWQNMTPEEKGRMVRRLADIYPWPSGKRPFIAPEDDSIE